MAAALAIEQLAAWNPKEITIEGLAHTGPLKSIDATTKTKAVAANPKWRTVGAARKRKKAKR
jgi:hypothetical protein